MTLSSHLRKSLSSASVSSTPTRSTQISQSTPVSTRTSLSISPPPPPSSDSAARSVASDAKIAQVIAHFEDPNLVIPVNETEASTDRGYLGGWVGGYGGGTGKKEGLSDDERFWLSRGCIIKFLEATRGDVLHAINRLTATLVWRRSFSVDTLSSDPSVELEASRRKHFYHSHTLSGHPIHYVAPVDQASFGGEEQIKHAVWFMEMAGPRYKGETGETVMLVDFSTTRSKSPSLLTTRHAISILQNHYPNRLHSAYFRNMSPIMASFLPCTYPFLDPRTRAKFKVDVDPLEDGIVEKSQLLKEWGGDAEFEPDHPGFFEELKRQHAEWKAKSMERWRRLGSHIGEDDLLLREDGDKVD